jgi:carbon monoxide dehydrogenase subunit G
VELTNQFAVPLSLDEAWVILTDIERIAPCLPGAQLQEVDGDEYRGVVKVKVGPITAQYKGVASITEQDQASGRVVLAAEGRDIRGQGNASATISATLVAGDGVTEVTVVTDLTITGKVAQFGRGVLADVSAKLLDQFVANLETTVLAADEPTPAPSTNGVAPGPRTITSPEPVAVDLVDAAGGAILRRLAPVAAGLVVLGLLCAYLRRR